MTIAYLDASALVKLLIEEDGSGDARLLYEGAAGLFSSRLATVEVVAALAAARRTRRFAERAWRDAVEVWSTVSSAIQPVELTVTVGPPRVPCS